MTAVQIPDPVNPSLLKPVDVPKNTPPAPQQPVVKKR